MSTATETTNGKAKPDVHDTAPHDRVGANNHAGEPAGDSRQAEPRVKKEAADAAGIDFDLLERVSRRFEAKLPTCDPDLAVLKPVAEAISDNEIDERVSDRIREEADVSSGLLDAGMLADACQSRQEELTAELDHLKARQDATPERIPLTKVRLTVEDKDGNPKEKAGGGLWLYCTRAMSWAVPVAAALAVSLVALVGIELGLEIGSLKGSRFEQAQTFRGAFGLVFAFTLGVLVLRSFRNHVLDEERRKKLEENLSRRGHRAAWWSLMSLGLLIGVYSAFPDENWLVDSALVPVKIALAISSLGLLACMGVALETWLFEKLDQAREWTLVPNEAHAALGEQMKPRKSQLLTVGQCKRLADEYVAWVTRHEKGEAFRWRSSCNELKEIARIKREVDKRSEQGRANEQAVDRLNEQLTELGGGRV